MASRKRVRQVRLFWTITVWDSTERLFERTIPVSHVRESDLEALLRTLVAKHGLTDAEITSCYLSRRAPARSSQLDIQREHNPVYAFHCGENPHVTAAITNADGRPLHPHERQRI